MIATHPLLKALALATVALTIALVILGAVVRVTNSGMGCPDWPLCYGLWLPPWEDRAAVLEWLHRTLAALVSLAAVALMGAIAVFRPLRARLGKPALLLIAALVAQIALGAHTVFQANEAQSVAWHLVMGYVFLGALLSIARRSLASPPPVAATRGARLALGVAVSAVLVQCFVGGLVAAGFAGRACPDFPTCQGAWLPPMAGPVGLQMAHRYVALVATLAVAAASVVAGGAAGGSARPFVRLALVVLLAQLAVGIVAVLGPFTLPVRVLHQVGAVSLFMACWLALDAALDAVRPARIKARPAERLPARR